MYPRAPASPAVHVHQQCDAVETDVPSAVQVPVLHNKPLPVLPTEEVGRVTITTLALLGDPRTHGRRPVNRSRSSAFLSVAATRTKKAAQLHT